MVRDHGFTADEATALTMQARSICGVRIHYMDVAVGVLILESTLAKEVSGSHAEIVANAPVTTALAQVLHQHREQVIRANGS